MVDYVEYPTDTLVKIVVPKKPHDGDGGGPGVTRDYPCGMYRSWTRFGNVFSVHPDGLYALYRITDVGTGTLSPFLWYYMPHLDIAQDLPSGEIDYLWSGPASFTITATDKRPFSTLAVQIKMWRNADPRTFDPCTQAPSAAGVTTIEVEAMQPTELWPPIVLAVGPTTCDGFPCELTVQAHCRMETTCALPPQPPPGPPWQQYWKPLVPPGDPAFVWPPKQPWEPLPDSFGEITPT